MTTPNRRRRVLVLLAALALLALPTAALANHFTDISHGSTHGPGVIYASEAGITQGCTPTEFCPTDNLTREQMTTFLYRASGHDLATPPSVNAASVAAVEQVSESNNVFGSAVNTASVSCPAGTAVSGGGAQTTSPTSWLQAFSRPLDDGSGWTARYAQIDGFLGVNTTTVWALCVPVGPS